MARNFGKTWWGNQWLNALKNIDWSNRIPRGASYARNGSVTQMKLKGNVIEAKVTGHYRSYYNVRIKIPPFTKEQVNDLMIALMQRPSTLSQLLNRQLSPEVLSIASELGIQVFPKSWNDLGMHCSCPDWAVPCKHLAAVIYMMSREIDNNPFLVFSMHGFDLLEEIGKRGATVSKDLTPQAAKMTEMIEIDHLSDEAHTHLEFRRVDFSHITGMLDSIMQLLAKDPPFYSKGDFHNHYQEELKKIGRKVRRVVEGRAELVSIINGTPFPVTKDMPVMYELEKKGRLTAKIPSSLKGKKTPLTDANSLMVSLMNTDDDYLMDFHPTWAASKQVLIFALHLLANGAIIPQLVEREDGSYAILWKAARQNKDVDDAHQQLQSIMPHGIIITKPGKEGTAHAVANSVEWLTDFFLNQLIADLSTKPSYIDEVHSLFFRCNPELFTQVGQTNIPTGICAWLDKLYIINSHHIPVLFVKEGDQDNFLLDAGVMDNNTPTLLKDAAARCADTGEKIAIYKELSQLTSLIPSLSFYIDQNGGKPIVLGKDEFTEFLFNTIPSLHLIGIKVMLPKSLQNLLRPKATMAISRKKDTEEQGHIKLSDLLDFNWKIALGDETISVEEFMKLLGKAKGLIRFKQSYIYVDSEDLVRIQDALQGNTKVDKGKILQAALSESYEGASICLTEEAKRTIKHIQDVAAQDIPRSINATLRPYQIRGYEWLCKNMECGFGSVLADDMGLGKTLQVITFMQHVKDSGLLKGDKRIIVVVPTGLISNWQAELHRFAPCLSSFVYHGPQRDLKLFEEDILITSYGVLRSDVNILKKKPWALIVIDEAQNIKNTNTVQTKAVKAIHADNCIAMSGTPVENRLSEFWSIMDFANKGYLGSAKNFKQEFAKPIQQEGNEKVAAQFRRITSPFMMRRLKTDKSIISDLPDKIETNEWAVMTEHQAALYEETLQHAMNTITGMDTEDSKQMFKRQGLILQMIMVLKQICNHPALFLKNSNHDPALSGKTDMLLTLLESIMESRQKVLVFTQFKEMGDILQQVIEERLGQRPLFLHGGCSVKKRQEMVDMFQNDRNTSIFLLSIKAAGTGLNLTAASHVIHFDLWWNPAVEAQATDRAYRIGQHQNVLVHRFITRNSFEERIDKMIQDKKHLADMTVATGENWIGNLSNEELKEIFR